MKINRILAIASILGAALFTSCKDDDTLASSMTLDQSSVSIYVGQTATLTPVFSPKGSEADLEWTSSDESVASVNCGGYVSGLKAGIATITAKSSNGLSATCSVNVANVTASKFTLNKSSLVLYEGETGEQLTATIEPDNVTFTTVTWTSSDPTVATVDANGNVQQVNIGTANITASLVDGSKATCTVKVTVRTPTEPETLDFWKNDNAGHRGLYGAASDNGKSAGTDGWLTYNDGIAQWTANTTGKVRTATLELSTGSKITITQVEGKDFIGKTATMTSKRFSNNTAVKKAGNPVGTDVLTFGKPILGETLEDWSGAEYTNCVGITGLFLEAVADAAFDINYDEKTIKLGLFLDARDNAQKVSTPALSGYDYVAFLPEMGGGAFVSPWNFIQVDLDATKDYAWLWFSSTDIKTFTYDASTAPQKLTGSLCNAAQNTIIGITVAASKSKNVNAADVKGANVIGANTGNYPVIYQGNPNNKGAQFTIVLN